MGEPQRQYQAEPDLDHYTDMSVGEILRKTREHYGQTIYDVEQNLNIRASQLHALEQENLDQIPGRVYAIGFVRAYSEYLGLDGDKMVHLFKAQSVGKRVKPELHFPVAVHESNDPNIHIVIASLTGLILFIAYLSIFHAPAKNESAIPQVPEEIKEKTIAMLQPPVPDAPDQSLLTGSEGLELRVTEESWVEIKNSEGIVIVRQILKKGDVFLVPEDETLSLSTGNAGGLFVYIDGKKIGALGKTSQVRRNIELKPETFIKPE
jgi:cytoskeletal protein RodZ